MKTVLLAAGFGSRLWPVSTSDRPKQFHPLINGSSLLRYTYDQMSKVVARDELYVLILEGMEDLVLQELPEIDTARLVVVPERRNTLPHTLWALSEITEDKAEPVLFRGVDQYAVDEPSFLHSLSDCLNNYHSAALTLLCSTYEKFNSNDGYCLVDESGAVLRFLEKPGEDEISGLANTHKILRSSFMYIASVQSVLGSLAELSDEWASGAQAVLTSGDENRKSLFLALPFLDISSALFQKSHKLRAEEIEYEFVDVGRFEEVYALNAKDKQGNVLLGRVLLSGDCKSNLIINKTSSPLVVISRSDLVIVQTEAGSLVSSFEEAYKVGEIYKQQIHGVERHDG